MTLVSSLAWDVEKYECALGWSVMMDISCYSTAKCSIPKMLHFCFCGLYSPGLTLCTPSFLVKISSVSYLSICNISECLQLRSGYYVLHSFMLASHYCRLLLSDGANSCSFVRIIDARQLLISGFDGCLCISLWYLLRCRSGRCIVV